ncbi:hypothetical protein J0H58_25390 [bacterium]|nr:hypothetical protein [bacterium]
MSDDLRAILLYVIPAVVVAMIAALSPILLRRLKIRWFYTCLYNTSYVEVLNRDLNRISIGRFQFALYGHLIYRGRNFNDVPQITERWSSVVLRALENTIYYIYNSRSDIESHNTTHGFGLIHCSEDCSGKLLPAHGYFRSADESEKVTQLCLIPLEVVEEKIGANLKDYSDASTIEFVAQIHKFTATGGKLC